MFEEHPRRVAVIGGGIAGLSAAYELQRQARSKNLTLAVDLIEASGRLGGAILTEREGEYLLDAGPDAMLTLKPSALDLCRELGLDDEIIPTRDEHRGVALYSRGKLRPLPYGSGAGSLAKIGAFVTSGVVSWPAKLRMTADLILPRQAVREDESMADFFSRRLGHETVERIVDPLLAGIYSGDPEKLSIHSTFPRFPQMVARRRSLLLGLLKARRNINRDERPRSVFVSLREGLGRLVDELEARLKDTTVHLNVPIASVRRTEEGYAVESRNGQVAQYAAVIIATPASVAGSILERLAPGPASKISSIRYVSTATVFLAYRRRNLSRLPHGHGFLVPLCERRRINGATWTTNKFAHRAPDDGFLVRCFVGGDRTPKAMQVEDYELVRSCIDELRDMAGIDSEPIFSRVYRWRESGPQYEVGHGPLVREIEEMLRGFPGLYVTGAGYRGIGIPDCIHDGRETARRLVASLSDFAT